MKLVSACLLGERCAWSGDVRYKNQRIVMLAKREAIIPVCPEQLGGLATPREPQEIQGGSGEDVLEGRCRVLNKSGEDVTEHFLKGAEETLKLVRQFDAIEFIGKSRSPSCGCGQIYDGSFSGRLSAGDGVTVAMLKRNGIRVILEEDV
jgi:uncharacterized protein YbbK (DUF523 family)